MVSVYVHVPFCKSKCPYCHFFVLKNNVDLHSLWFEAIKNEWSRVKILIQDPVLTLYLGGGTPSLLSSPMIKELISTIGGAPVEVTLEANPEDVTYEKALEWKEAGVNRVSMGVQSFNQEELILLGRGHSASLCEKAVISLYRAGIDNISLDLMYDLPNQTLKSWKNSLNSLKNLPITHLSLYNLTIEPHTSFHKRREELEKKMPKGPLSRDLYLTAVETLEEQGWERYEISAFCKRGKRSLHNKGYWQGRPFLGLGPSAFSYFNGQRWQNIAHLKKYAEASDPISFKETLSPQERINELFIIGLRLKEGINLQEFEKNVGPLLNETKELLLQLEERGLIRDSSNQPHLTLEGVLFYDTVAVELI